MFFKIATANDIDELNTVLRDVGVHEILVALGSKTKATSTDEKDHFIKIIARHVLLDRVRYLLEDLIDGLRTLGVLDKIKENPREFEKCLCRDNKPLTAEMVDALFHIDYAEQGSNSYAAQQRAIVYWNHYLQDCEGKLAHHMLRSCVNRES